MHLTTEDNWTSIWPLQADHFPARVVDNFHFKRPARALVLSRYPIRSFHGRVNCLTRVILDLVPVLRFNAGHNYFKFYLKN